MSDEPISDVDFDAEAEGGVSAYKEKIAKLKAQLDEVRKERQEYLDGWQRCRADAANISRDSKNQIAGAAARAKEEITESLLPVLDGFDMAMGAQTWGSVDAQWRTGIEYIHTQLITILSERGVQRYGSTGDMFDHALHEALEETAGESGVIQKVIRSGYKNGDRVIRPAQVVVGK